MKITNRANLPETIVRAVPNDPYDRGDADYSVSDLVNPVRAVHLIRRHSADLNEDAADRIWALLGQAVHSVLERAETDNSLAEERLNITLDVPNEDRESVRRTVSSKTDLYHGNGLLQDYKVTSAWTAVYKSRYAEWEENLNMRAHILRANGWLVNSWK